MGEKEEEGKRGGGEEEGRMGKKEERGEDQLERINGLLCASGYILTCIFVLVKDVLHTTEGIVL